MSFEFSEIKVSPLNDCVGKFVQVDEKLQVHFVNRSIKVSNRQNE